MKLSQLLIAGSSDRPEKREHVGKRLKGWWKQLLFEVSRIVIIRSYG
jgi:hypothetical protein